MVETEDSLQSIVTSEMVETEEEEVTPNNDFCFTEEDFIATQTELNDATRHIASQGKAWNEIKAMKGKVVCCNNAKDGKCEWTVVENVTEIFLQRCIWRSGSFTCHETIGCHTCQYL